MIHIVQPFFGGYRDWNGREKASVMFESRWLFRWVGLNGMPYLPSRAYRTLCREMDTVRGLPNDGQQSRKAHQTGEPRGLSPSGGNCAANLLSHEQPRALRVRRGVQGPCPCREARRRAAVIARAICFPPRRPPRRGGAGGGPGPRPGPVMAGMVECWPGLEKNITKTGKCL